MAAASHVFTVRRVAQMLGETEDRLFDIAMTMDPEDGCLWVLDLTDDGILAFTAQGIENLKELLSNLGA